jgi:hypothetical protein
MDYSLLPVAPPWQPDESLLYVAKPGDGNNEEKHVRDGE